jgi:DNA-directed RNA polymerase specialized sigma24 family protein
VQKGNQSLPQSAEVVAEEKGSKYVGPWLPEPIRTPEADTLETTLVRRDLLSYAMLVLLERLTPTERTVFVLREAFGFDYLEIAELLGKRETNCRMLMSRARSKMGITEEEPVAAEAVELEWVSRFLTHPLSKVTSIMCCPC